MNWDTVHLVLTTLRLGVERIYLPRKLGLLPPTAAEPPAFRIGEADQRPLLSTG